MSPGIAISNVPGTSRNTPSNVLKLIESQVQAAKTPQLPSVASQRCAYSSLHSSSQRPATPLRSSQLPSTTIYNGDQQLARALGCSPGFRPQSYRSASRLARAIMPRPGTAAETYVAYGMTQKLFEACSRQAEYSIPQLSQKGVPVPKTEAGEDIGVGEGWWYQGSLRSPPLCVKSCRV